MRSPLSSSLLSSIVTSKTPCSIVPSELHRHKLASMVHPRHVLAFTVLNSWAIFASGQSLSTGACSQPFSRPVLSCTPFLLSPVAAWCWATALLTLTYCHQWRSGAGILIPYLFSTYTSGDLVISCTVAIRFFLNIAHIRSMRTVLYDERSHQMSQHRTYPALHKRQRL